MSMMNMRSRRRNTRKAPAIAGPDLPSRREVHEVMPKTIQEHGSTSAVQWAERKFMEYALMVGSDLQELFTVGERVAQKVEAYDIESLCHLITSMFEMRREDVGPECCQRSQVWCRTLAASHAPL